MLTVPPQGYPRAFERLAEIRRGVASKALRVRGRGRRLFGLSVTDIRPSTHRRADESFVLEAEGENGW